MSSNNNNPILKDDSLSKKEIEDGLKKEQNPTWQKKLNYDNFIVVSQDIPQSLEVVVVMGFKNPEAKDPTDPNTIRGQHLRVDWWRAKEIMAKPKQELYDAYIAKDKTVVLD